LETTGETADPHPAVRAWQEDAVHVTDSLVDSGPAGDWRQRALTAGYQSICAVPISYDGVTHGVLSVATDRPNAFGDREQEVLAQLGTSIANAVVAIERRRALESDETVQLEFTGAGGSLAFARAADAAGCRVTLERTVARQDGSVSVYYSFDRGVPDDVADVANRALDGAVTVVAEESASTLVEVQTDDWFGSPLAEYGGVLRSATAEPDETTIVVEVPQQADVRSFVDRLQAIAPSLDLVARRQHTHRSSTPAELGDRIQAELTDRQFEVLQTALAAGYFEWPRDNDGTAVADRLDITQPTLNKHLRLAQKQLFGMLLEDDD
jgi:predicted DNA binding protein